MMVFKKNDIRIMANTYWYSIRILGKMKHENNSYSFKTNNEFIKQNLQIGGYCSRIWMISFN